jgi:two-component system, OmpR family, response regulator VicR
MQAGARCRHLSGDGSADDPLRSDFGCGHVLIIDDEASIIEVLTEILTEAGWRVTGWQSPPPLDDIRDLDPDVILLDLLFNGNHDGLTLLESIRLNPSLDKIPIVVCTAMPNPHQLVTSADHQPVINIVAKPFDLDEVVSTVTLARQRSFRVPIQDC